MYLKKLKMLNKDFVSSNRNIYINDLQKKESNVIIYKQDDINELPFTQAIYKDKRNFFTIFFSIIIQKIELVNLIFGEQKIKILLINQYILSLIIDFFFNTFLYSDEVVSNKYHNNGRLEFTVTLLLSITSNIITGIICTYLNLTKGIEERLEQILDIK